jgi:hypothetical protein
MPPLVLRAARVWLPVAVAATILVGVLYAAVQHLIRSGANSPQVQLAEDTASRLDAGATPEAVVPAEPVDMARSLAPYFIVFDGDGRVVASSVTLNGQQPVFPASVFDSVRRMRQDRITWQPAPRVRSAVVVVPYRAGFVLAGRSLRLAEEQVDSVQLLVFLGWLATLIATAVAALVGARVATDSGRL